MQVRGRAWTTERTVRALKVEGLRKGVGITTNSFPLRSLYLVLIKKAPIARFSVFLVWDAGSSWGSP